MVNEDGTISDCHIIKGLGSGCDEEAIRVVSHMPAWKKPDVVNGIKVKAPYTLPVYFKLTDDKLQGHLLITDDKCCPVGAICL